MHNLGQSVILKVKPFPQRLEISERVSLQKVTDSVGSVVRPQTCILSDGDGGCSKDHTRENML